MKRLFVIAGILISLSSFGQAGVQTAKPVKKNTVPSQVITNDSTHWTISTLSTVGYVNTTPGAYYNTYKSGGGMIVKFRFKEGNRFEFMLYVQANTYGTDTETWTQVEGNVEFTKDHKGQAVFITRAEKGTYRIVKNGNTTTRPIAKKELETQHSNTYLWEVTSFKDDPSRLYMLVVDMDAHPTADISDPKTIDPSWVSKFHIPVKSFQK
jgi:hypothetical protein